MNTQQQFVDGFCALAHEAHLASRKRGTWDDLRSDGECIAMMHADLSRALEALSHGNPVEGSVPPFSQGEAALAELIVRIMDFAVARQFFIAEALVAKMETLRMRREA